MDSHISRRDILAGGGILLGTALLGGCAAGGGQAAALPDPAWPNPHREPTVKRPPVVPTEPVAANTGQANEPIPTGVISRSQWTSAGVGRPRDINPMNGVNRITVHHAGFDCSDLRTQSQAATRIESIRKTHVNSNGWADIGYHFVIDPQGRVWAGRDTKYQGAHVQDNNEHNLGIMLLGNFDRERPSDAAIRSLDRFVAAQMHNYRVPVGRVYTHKEIRPTACPGKSLQSHMLKARASGGSIRVALAELQRAGSSIYLT